MPGRPSLSAAQNSPLLWPKDEITPMPEITTRRCGMVQAGEVFAQQLKAAGAHMFIAPPGWLPSWVNRADSFMEGDPNLVTGYALLALAYARPVAVGE